MQQHMRLSNRDYILVEIHSPIYPKYFFAHFPWLGSGIIFSLADMLWVDRHRPKDIAALSLKPELSSRLTQMASNALDLPHLLLHGPSGAGKLTRVHALLREIFGPGSLKVVICSNSYLTRYS